MNMNVIKKNLEKSQVEINVELTLDEFKPYIDQGVIKLSKDVKIEGFRPGKVPYDILKQKIGEMSILEEAARIAINKTIDKALFDNVKEQPVGQPQVSITKLAPDNPMEYKVVLALIPEMTLGDYKNAKVKAEKAEIKDEEIDKTITQLREMRAKEVMSDQPIKDGDKVIANIKMFLDKVPVEGGQSKDTAVIIGKDYFVPGFDKKLIGAKKNDVREFKLPYPKDHHQANLAGKMVEFKVTVKQVFNREIPKMDDELASNFGVKTLDEFKKNVKQSLEHERKHQAEQKTDIKMLDKIMAGCKFSDIPQVLIDHEAQIMMAELEQGVTQQGGKFEDYLTSLKKTREQMMLDIMPDAVKRVKSALMIREIAIKEKIKVEEKEVDEEVEKLIKQYKGYEKVEQRVKEPSYRAYLKNSLTNKKVIDKLREWNVEK